MWLWLGLIVLTPLLGQAESKSQGLTLVREGNYLIIQGPKLPGPIRIHYLEAYCRAGSTDADWVKHTMIPHESRFLADRSTPKRVEIEDQLSDGVNVSHVITAGQDEVTFQVTARNPTSVRSEAHWAQPCVRLSAFMGYDESHAGNATDYLPRCFLFIDGKLTRMPTPDWATSARYTPGQCWCPSDVPRTDVNPRPLNPRIPSNGLIGCYGAGDQMVFATAWEPYQELFQGVIRCLHSDFRLGGLQPGETRRIRGKIYLVPNDIPKLLRRYRKDFPNQSR